VGAAARVMQECKDQQLERLGMGEQGK